MKNRLPHLVLLALLLVALSAQFAFAADDDAAETLADPSKYSQDWRTNGPPGGDVRSLVVDPTNPDRFYFGTLDGQIYTSFDSGRNWTLLYNFNRPKLFIDAIIVDPRDSQTLYAGAHRHKEPGGFFKSTDGGRTWREARELRRRFRVSGDRRLPYYWPSLICATPAGAAAGAIARRLSPGRTG